MKVAILAGDVGSRNPVYLEIGGALSQLGVDGRLEAV